MKQEKSNIDSLVEKFWNNELSEQEVEFLKSIRDSKSFRAQHPQTAEYLSAIEDHQTIMLSEDIKKRIIDQTKPRIRRSSIIYWVSGIAASLALTLWISVSSNNNEYSQEEIQLAYQQTKEVLYIVSSKMEEGRSHTMNLKHFDKSKEQLIQELQLN